MMRGMRVLVTAVAAVAAAGCAQARPAGETTATLELTLRTEVARIQESTEKLYGHALGRPVTLSRTSRKDLGETIDREMAERQDDEAAARNKRLLVSLHLIPADAELGTVARDFMQASVAGYYDPDDKSLHIVGAFDIQNPGNRGTVAHEIVHALQDARWDLNVYSGAVKDNNDAVLARRAVVEGDATVTEHWWRLEQAGRDPASADFQRIFKGMEAGASRDPGNRRWPPFLIQTSLFPYTKGGLFLSTGRMADMPARRERAFLDPPRSTEQILHPLKYWGTPRDEPTTVTLGSAPEDLGFVEADRDTWGEWGTMQFLTMPREGVAAIHVTLDPMVNDPDVAEASKGWDGDQAVYLERPRGDGTYDDVFVWRTVWDGAIDTRQFEGALRRRLAVFPEFKDLPPKTLLTETPLGGEPVVWKGTGRQATFSRTRQAVTLTLTRSPEGEAAAKAVLESTR